MSFADAVITIRLNPEIEDALLALARHAKWKIEARTLRVFRIGHETQGATSMDTIKADDNDFLLGYDARDAHDNPTTIQTPVWSSSDESLATITAEGDGSVARFHHSGVVGVGQIRLDGDADLGEGVRPIFGLYEYEVLAGDAVVVTLKRIV